MKVLVLGANGMLGHMVSAFLTEHHYDIITTSRSHDDPNYYDAYKNVYSIKDIIKNHRPDAVVNCIGILNATAENHHALAVMVNSFLPNYLDELSTIYHFRFIHITTDCVFDGKTGNYTEDARPNATSFYGLSKALGEINNDHTLTLRLSIVGPDNNPNGIGLFKWFSEQTGAVHGYTKVYWTGITTLELAKVIDKALHEDHLTGLHHVVNNEKISKSDLLHLFNKYFHFNNTIIDDNTVVSDKSLLRTNQSFDFQIPSYDQMIQDMYQWVIDHPALYPTLIERIQK